jgi:microsomal epoxide hydrolase
MKRNIIISLFSIVLITSVFCVFGAAADKWTENKKKVGDIKIRYLEAGSGDRALIFIPGWTMTADIWREQIPYFSARGFRVIAMDPRSHGSTSKTDTGNTYRQHAADLHALVQELQIEDSYLVGWASGVATILEYVSASETITPEKIVFVNGSPGGLKVDDYPGSITIKEAQRILFGFQDDREKTTERLVRDFFSAQQPEWLIKDLVKDSLKTPTAAAISLYMDYFIGNRRSALMHVSAPCLIMTTSDTQAVGEYMKSQIARPELITIEDTGSAIFLEKPQAFNQTVEAFLGEY